MRRRGRALGGLAIIVAVGILAGCSQQVATQVRKHDRHSRTVAVGGPTRPYALYTHCGIDEARIGNHYFEAVRPLSDGNDNPPPGWGNPYQQGTMTLLSPTEALFSDDVGHHVLFGLRHGARSFKHVCA